MAGKCRAAGSFLAVPIPTLGYFFSCNIYQPLKTIKSLMFAKGLDCPSLGV